MTLINNFKTEVISVTRFGKGEYIKGTYASGKKIELTIDAVFIPFKGNEHELLSEGKRAKEVGQVYTKEPLFPANDKAGTKADIITARNKTYEIKNVENWTHTDLNHYRSIAIEIERNVDERKVK